MASRGEIDARISSTVRSVYHIGRLARREPREALAQADAIEDASMKASVLIAIAKNTRTVEPLSDARDILLGTKLPGKTKTNKLAKVSFTAVGLDNVFAAETAREVPGAIANAQMLRALSVGMTGSIRMRIEGDDMGEFNNYPDLVVASFRESVGDSSYFEQPEAAFDYIRVPAELLTGARLHPLDPIRDGGRVLDAFRDNPRYFGQMMDFLTDNGPALPSGYNLGTHS